MDQPQPLIALFEDLRAEGGDSSVEVAKGSYANIYLSAGDSPIVIGQEECALVLASPDTVRQLFEVLGEPPDAAIELHLVGVAEEVQDALERQFAAVDEI